MEALRTTVAARVGITHHDSHSFKWAIAAEVLRRQGLSNAETGTVLDRSLNWVEEAQREMEVRMQHKAFRRSIEAMLDIYDNLARLAWEKR
jgi:hypothetical protein